MDQRPIPPPRLAPLAAETTPARNEQFEAMSRRMGFIPNSVLIMQRNPKLVRAFVQMAAAVWDPEGSVDLRLKRLISHVASRAAGCQYCMAHTADGAARLGVDQRKIDAVGTTRQARCSAPPSVPRSMSRPVAYRMKSATRCSTRCASTGRKSRSSRSWA